MKIPFSFHLPLLVTLLPEAVKATPIPPVPVVQTLNVQQQLYQALALGALSLLAILHRSLVSVGFTVGSFNGTDVLCGAAICVGSVLWFTLVLATGWTNDGQPCRQSLGLCLGRLSYAPNILLITSLIWARSLWEIRMRTLSKPRRLYFQIWRSCPDEGQFAWGSALTRTAWVALILLVVAFTVLFSYGSMRSHEYLIAVLNIIGATLFISQATGRNIYNAAVQRYKGLIRIVIGTDHIAGTTYVFSGATCGIRAVYGPCIEEEHRLVNETTLQWLRKMRTERTTPVQAGQILRTLAIDLGKRTMLNKAELNVLGRWFYLNEPQTDASMQPRSCKTFQTSITAVSKAERTTPLAKPPSIYDFQTTQGSSSIGRESVYALFQLEFLLFSRRNDLDSELKAHIGEWRNLETTGAEWIDCPNPLIGHESGLDGLKQALRRVGNLLGQDQADVIPTQGRLPRHPKFTVLDRYYDYHEDYAAALWDYCCKGSEGVLLSLYLFLAIWQSELGATAGYHPVPLRQKKDSHAGDLIIWSVLWRQGWYTAVVAQATGLLSAVVGAFIAGLLQ